MALDSYINLQAAVASWLDREDLAAQVPDFISLAESRASNRLRVADMEVAASATLTNGAVTLPADFIEARRIITSGTGAYNTPLEFISPVQAGQTYPSSAAGVPVHFSISGGVLTTYPNGGAGTVTMIYYARLPALAIWQANWLLTKAPDVYLYGALLEAAPFLGDDGRIQTWAGLFEQAVNALQAADQRSRYANSVSRVRCPTP